MREPLHGGPPTLGELFRELQTELRASLEGNRRVLRHPTTKGDATELCWLEMLGSHLPKQYELARASVIDADGRASDSIDIVIFDRQYTPKLFCRDGALYLPAESVYAAIEVKQDLTKSNLEYASEKIASVRRLRRTSTRVRHAGGTYTAVPPPRIIGAVLTLASGWDPPFAQPFRRALHSLSGEGRIDMGCALVDGSFEVVGKRLRIKPAEDALVGFFGALFVALQKVGTVPALDLEAYLDHAVARPSRRGQPRKKARGA